MTNNHLLAKEGMEHYGVLPAECMAVWGEYNDSRKIEIEISESGAEIKIQAIPRHLEGKEIYFLKKKQAHQDKDILIETRKDIASLVFSEWQMIILPDVRKNKIYNKLDLQERSGQTLAFYSGIAETCFQLQTEKSVLFSIYNEGWIRIDFENVDSSATHEISFFYEDSIFSVGVDYEKEGDYMIESVFDEDIVYDPVLAAALSRQGLIRVIGNDQYIYQLRFVYTEHGLYVDAGRLAGVSNAIVNRDLLSD